jgi:hypothetical protein
MFLVGIRDEKELAKLPEAGQKTCERSGPRSTS